MAYSTIKFKKEGQIGIIQLNRPERMNAVIEEMYIDIQMVLNDARQDGDIRVLILTGSVLKKGDTEKQAFCAGADLKKHAGGERTHQQKRAYIKLAHDTTGMLYAFPKPVIAAVNGPARGAGAEMALSCDFIFMANEATIGFPETGLGTFVGGGVTAHLPRIVGQTRAKELVYTGKIIDGKTAEGLGLALKTFPVKTLLDETKAFAEVLAMKAPMSIELAKKRLQDSTALDMETVLLLETDGILSCMDTEDWHEGIQAYNEKRKPVFRGR